METNDFSRITTLSQLRQTRKDVSEQIHILEENSARSRDQYPMLRGPQLNESLFYEIN